MFDNEECAKVFEKVQKGLMTLEEFQEWIDQLVDYVVEFDRYGGC